MSARLDGLLLLPLRRPALAFALVAALTLLALALAPGLEVDVRLEKVFPQRDPRLADYERLRALFGRDDETALCLLELPEDVLSAASLDRIHALSEGLCDLPEVDARTLTSLSHAPFVRVEGDDTLFVGALWDPSRRAGWDPDATAALVLEHPLFVDRLVSRDRRLAAIFVPMAHGPRDGPARRRFVGALEGFFAARLRPDERVHLDGFAVTYDTVLRLLVADTARYFTLALALLVGALYLVFRRALACALALGTILLTVTWTVGLMAALGVPVTWLSTALPVVLAVVCVGDTVHLVARFDLRRAEGLAPGDAAAAAVRDVGRACLYTSLTTAAGFLSLLTSQVELVRDLGLPVGLGVPCAWVVTFALGPPALARWPGPPPGAGPSTAGLSRWLRGPLAALTGFTARRPRAVVLGTVALCLACLPLAPRVPRETRLMQELDPDQPLMQTRALFEARMGGVAPLDLLVLGATPGRALEPDVMRGLLALGRRLRAPDLRARGVLFALSAADLVADAHWTLHDRDPALEGVLPDRADAIAQLRFLYALGSTDPTARLLDDPDLPAAARLQVRVRNLYTRDLLALAADIEREARALLPPDVEVRLTGTTLMSQAVHATMVGDLALSLGAALVAVGLLVLALFRSPLLALLALAPNVVILAPLLALMALFGVALSTSTCIVFAVVLGIAIDDTIHVIAALAEQPPDAPDPIGATVEHTGLALVLSSVVLALGFLVLAASSFRANRDFGLLVAATVVFALAADLLLLPALLRWAREAGLLYSSRRPM